VLRRWHTGDPISVGDCGCACKQRTSCTTTRYSDADSRVTESGVCRPCVPRTSLPRQGEVTTTTLSHDRNQRTYSLTLGPYRHSQQRASFCVCLTLTTAPLAPPSHCCPCVAGSFTLHSPPVCCCWTHTHILSRSLALQVKLAVTIALGYLVCVQIFQMLFDEEDPTAPIAAGQEGEREAVARVQAVLPMASEEDIRAELSECHSRCS
jgi:hypothetical protein